MSVWTIPTRLAVLIGLSLVWAPAGGAQTDPGPRLGSSGAGGPVPGLSEAETNLFWAAKERFTEATSVSGTIERGIGLGPMFNGNSCAACHAQPSAGGSSPGLTSPQVRRLVLKNNRLALTPRTNPQIELATLHRASGGSQEVPSFITPDGPVRVPRFIRKPDGTLDGSVHDIYSIAGRIDAPGCVLPQPNFSQQIADQNVVFRIPTPTFGAGLIEAIPDDTLTASWSATGPQRKALGIGGRFNRSMNDGTITRFGWKAQNKSLLLFAAESYNVEEGVTNDIFPDEREHAAGCLFNTLPEDTTRLKLPPGATFEPAGYASDLVNFASFMRLLAPPEPAPLDKSAQNGSKLFRSTGCALCHSPVLVTGSSPFTGMSRREVHPYSDFALHHMGPGLADHVAQGLAGGDEFRTAPLWGIGQRLFFLHDGRPRDLLTAIEAHLSADSGCRRNPLSAALNESCASEANAVIARFNALSASEKQDILNFLRSL